MATISLSDAVRIVVSSVLNACIIKKMVSIQSVGRETFGFLAETGGVRLGMKFNLQH